MPVWPPDPAFDRALAAFREHARIEPSDEQLWRLAYLIKLAAAARPDLTHGKAHRELAKAVRIILREAPTLTALIGEAEAEAEAAQREGRATHMDRYACLVRNLLAAASGPFDTSRHDHRGAWHGWARLMADEVRTIFRHHGKPEVSFTHETSPGVLIVATLLGKEVGQVIEALRKDR